jgi:hypothetical protein
MNDACQARQLGQRARRRQAPVFAATHAAHDQHTFMEAARPKRADMIASTGPLPRRGGWTSPTDAGREA